jgi:hypothetical protein
MPNQDLHTQNIFESEYEINRFFRHERLTYSQHDKEAQDFPHVFAERLMPLKHAAQP